MSSLVTALVILLATSWSSAETKTFSVEPSKDTSLYSEGPRSNGKGPGLFVGCTGLGDHRRALALFDIATPLPPSAQIVSAQLTASSHGAEGGDSAEMASATAAVNQVGAVQMTFIRDPDATDIRYLVQQGSAFRNWRTFFRVSGSDDPTHPNLVRDRSLKDRTPLRETTASLQSPIAEANFLRLAVELTAANSTP